MNWFGHVVRRGEDSYVYGSYKDCFPGKRKPGRPPKRWSDQICQDMDLPLLTTERNAKDRYLTFLTFSGGKEVEDVDRNLVWTRHMQRSHEDYATKSSKSRV